jgi:hypothetical protein
VLEYLSCCYSIEHGARLHTAVVTTTHTYSSQRVIATQDLAAHRYKHLYHLLYSGYPLQERQPLTATHTHLQ